MAADDLAMQKAKSSAATVSTYNSQTIPTLAPDGLTIRTISFSI